MASDVVSLLGQVVAGLEARQLNRELAAQMTMAVVQFCETESGMWRRLNRNQQRWAQGVLWCVTCLPSLATRQSIKKLCLCRCALAARCFSIVARQRNLSTLE